jgi:hypothetical protein
MLLRVTNRIVPSKRELCLDIAMTRPLPTRAYNSRMKGLAAIVLAVAIAFQACAQRGGGGHASFASHSAPAARPAPAFHGSYAPSMPIRYPGTPIAHATASYPSSMRILAPGVRYPASAPIIRPSFYHPTHPVTVTHNFYIHTYPIYPYAYYPSYVYGYLPSDLADDSYGNYDLSQQPMQPEQQPDYGYPQPMPQPEYGNAYPQPAPEAAYAYPPGYAPQPTPVAPQMQYAPGSATTVILIYKDGRPPEQIQNYLATRSTLTVLDGGRRREIPLSDLNIPATVSANHQTGVDFQLPSTAP